MVSNYLKAFFYSIGQFEPIVNFDINNFSAFDADQVMVGFEIRVEDQGRLENLSHCNFNQKT